MAQPFALLCLACRWRLRCPRTLLIRGMSLAGNGIGRTYHEGRGNVGYPALLSLGQLLFLIKRRIPSYLFNPPLRLPFFGLSMTSDTGKILVVDDQADMRGLLFDVLETEG